MRHRAILLCLLLLATLTGALVAVVEAPGAPQQAAQASAAPRPYVTPEAALERLSLAQARASRSRQAVVPKPSASPMSTTRRHPPRKPVTIRSRPTHRPAARYSTGSLKAYAEALVGPAQMACLDPLWEHESGWSVTDSYGDAYGIPQAKPGYKMASAGADWRTNGRTQIRWGVGYIRERYGSACAAWSHYQGHSWY